MYYIESASESSPPGEESVISKRGCTFGIRLSRNYWRFYQKLNSTFLNNMESELVSLGVWESKEIIYHYDFIPSSTLFRSIKFLEKSQVFENSRANMAKWLYSRANILKRIFWEFEREFSKTCLFQGTSCCEIRLKNV